MRVLFMRSELTSFQVADLLDVQQSVALQVMRQLANAGYVTYLRPQTKRRRAGSTPSRVILSYNILQPLLLLHMLAVEGAC